MEDSGKKEIRLEQQVSLSEANLQKANVTLSQVQAEKEELVERVPRFRQAECELAAATGQLKKKETELIETVKLLAAADFLSFAAIS